MSSSSSSTRAPDLIAEIQNFFNTSLRRCYPNSYESCRLLHLEGEPFEKYGDDYMCHNVLFLCAKLKPNDKTILSEDIAKTIIRNLPISDMIPKVSICCGCYLTFKLSRKWMHERIENMLTNGICTWAPTFDYRKALILFPHGDDIRAHYIHDVLTSTFAYSGLEVSPDSFSKKERVKGFKEVEKRFLFEEGQFKKRRGRIDEPPLFVADKTDALFSIARKTVYADLACLWNAIYLRKTDLLLYLAPLCRRDYIERCFKAARDVRWLNNERVCYFGYRTSPDEKEKLACLWHEFNNYSKLTSLLDMGKAAGYVTRRAVFELALKYAYLKTNRLDEFPSSIDELFDEKGNTLVYLLHTQALVRSVIDKPRGGAPKLMKALVAKEHELASHLVRFTVVLKEACSVVLPNKLCEYLYNLSKKFTSCYGEVRPVETGLLLCRATSVVMEKCFHLLGINPNNSRQYLYRDHFLSPKASKIVMNPFLPWSNYGDARLDVSRIELFSMYICIYDDIQKGHLHGLISLKDNKTNGFVDFFSRDICKQIPMGNRSYIFFSDPSASYELSLDSPIEICMNLVVTCEKDHARKDAYELLRGRDKLETANFWQDDTRTKCLAKPFETNTGLLQIHYILLKDAFDTTLEVTFESPDSKGLRVRGHIFAWYGKSVLDRVPEAERMFYRASIFTTVGTPVLVFPGKKLQLNKSCLAVPAGGDLVLQAVLEDTESRKILADDQVTYSLNTNEGFQMWEMQVRQKGKAKKGSNSSNGSLAPRFNLTLKWRKGPASSFPA